MANRRCRSMQVQPYLFFSGECEEALNMYRSVFGGEIVSINRYGGSPMEKQAPPDWTEKVMHATFVAGDITLMAADSSHTSPGANNARARLSVGTADHAEGQRVFDSLADGGTITMPYTKQFWGASFGMLTDRFGIEWMVNSG
jgi:PhnB protein